MRLALLLIPFLSLAGCGQQNMSRDLTHEPGNPLVNNGRWSALHEAIDKKDTFQVMDLINKGVNVRVISASPKEHNITPLHLAMQRELPEIVKLLLEKGALVNGEMSTGTTALHIAVETSQVEMVKLLLEKGANPSLESFYVHSPLKIAQKKGHEKILKMLQERIKGLPQEQ